MMMMMTVSMSKALPFKQIKFVDCASSFLSDSVGVNR